MEVKLTHAQPDACEECKSMVGDVVDTDYPEHPIHPNCRCTCEPIEEDEANNETANGQNGQAIEANEPDPITAKAAAIDNDEPIDVQVSVIGDVMGSDANGNPIKQTINEESLSKIAETLNSQNKEVLVDVDHQSERDGLERNTKAAGWLSKFWTSTKGLFAKLKLTPYGKTAVEGKEYRKLSPVFTLDKDHRPIGLKSVAMTNTPAMMNIENILNQTPKDTIKMEITKEELVELIKETVVALNSEPTVETECGKDDKAVNEDATTDAPTDTPTDAPDTPETPTEPEPAEPVETTEESKTDKVENEDPSKLDEAKVETEIVEQPVEEVIKEESLNQAPTVAMPTDAPWKQLHGEEFFKWARENLH